MSTTTFIFSTPPKSFNKDNDTEDSTDGEMNIHLYNDTLASLLKWIEEGKFNDETNSDAQETLVKHIYTVAKWFNLVKILTLPTPSPPPPCMRPHSNEEDIHMEPPIPTCVFSEAATQTPAPIHVVTMSPPPPPSVLSANSIPAAAMTSKPGPLPRPSFAEAAAKTLHPITPQPPSKAPQGAILSKHSKQPYFAT
ncbi:hypothetical protein P691DRAFT_766939 [Macrolepiota fuliginosa MF-IS2]|uniref:Uncharacterized protein n=1 Tax=Macrolepiota fuliginosa MF-IS2 TaxID=1400762 RepID=A0A9P5WYS1_9AGAR|nr:hypothetical protein P691DRAFT_766939 [Macrolepiota fuliginosa MF-IS2]